ncbi:MAG: hypothetical protein GY753_11400, partial [Gammaproteobacteria bacterium]|nr:hypothetical protein [Gammaproteobacteria bacterium]
DQKATHFGIDLSGLLQRIAAFRDNPDEQGYPELADIADRWENSIKQLNSESERGSARSGTDGY